MVPWAEVLAFLHHLEALAAAGTVFQVIETPGQVPGVGAEAPAAPSKAAASPRLRRTAAKTCAPCILVGVLIDAL
jgi:hypothetical protein